MPFSVFISYAHQDRAFCRELEKHLSILRRQNVIASWYDRDISPGTDWKSQIIEHLNTDHIILLLISADFMASDFCYSLEMLQAIARHDANQARVLPIILRPTDWQGAPFAKLQALPSGAKAITTWPTHDEAFTDVVRGIRRAIKDLIAQPSVLDFQRYSSPKRSLTIEFSIQHEDITSFEADVVALKYAQKFYGTDELIAGLLNRAGIAEEQLQPRIGDYSYVDTHSCISSHHALFVGVPPLLKFGYHDVQEFSESVLDILAKEAPDTRHLMMTIHGVGFGLDDIESFSAQFSGYIRAIQSGRIPSALEYITIVDRSLGRVLRLRQALEQDLAHADYAFKVRERWAYRLDILHLNDIFKRQQSTTRIIENLEIESKAKPHIFVAMPFKKDMDDIFYYGIQQPVNAAGFLCERVDQDVFIGGILDQVKKKIDTAAVVIAELSGANPNVYLEVGYAWGKGRPTILLVKNEEELRFDVRDQRCLKYERIRDLEEILNRELKELKTKGFL